LLYSYTLLTIIIVVFIYEENDFAKGSKIFLDTDLIIILLDQKNNFVGNKINEDLKIMSNVAKNFDILAISLSVLHKYFDNSTILIFLFVSK